ncbi:manganese efflux pump MntP family protein [Alicyclobacillus macrosporangiidus]|uniref:Putative Mn2+ efflux pump MntP n=1 Tax=Alicyclobacillus macrosporangiidus TaxID=392015 RepID=A0A1I7GRY2_9BACL|nr:manganese efflux pump [Alicyclobacillus macrosporangiidus]SFU51141.1 Putative Mn2+ efflux pump MntP [Alicyclobacillus macrosporangiidus]
MLLQLVLIGLALGMNNTLASVALGTTNMKRSQQMGTAVLFALFEAVMPLAGLFLGGQLSRAVGGASRDVGVGLLVILGAYLIVKAEEAVGPPGRTMGVRSLMLAVVLSLDNLTVGFGLGMLHVPILLAAAVFGLVSLTMTLLGLELGRWLGARLTVPADRLSGVVLLGIAALMWFTG